jgi:PPOX class probable F420-dependent enzyme
MVAIPDSARPILEGANLAHLVTIEPDGSPQVSCVWVGLDGDEVVFASLGPWRKLRNLQRDPRVALSIESPEKNHLGMREYLVLQGTARVETGGAPEVLQELAHVYVGPDVRFPPMDDPPPGSVVRITVDRVGGVGPWTGEQPPSEPPA